MLEVVGFEVLDLGIDVPVQNFVDEVKETGSTIIGLSGLLTITFDIIKETIDAIRTASPSSSIKILIGSGQIDEHVKSFTGADVYGEPAMDTVKLSKELKGGNSI